MPNRNRQSGDRAERRVVGLLKRAGLNARRVPLSGSAGGEFSGDVLVDRDYLDYDTGPLAVRQETFRGEVKRRKGCAGYRQVVEWLGTNDLLFLHRDRDTPVVAMPFALLVRLLGGAFPPAGGETNGEEGGANG